MSLVDRAAGLLARKSNRRGFLTRTALVGTALAADPVGYAIRPGTAYAAICSCRGSQCDCGSLCCDGYTGFCCELTGENRCPPGTVLGGWWKVDASSFCGGNGPRYYMDCNYYCPSGCGCGSSGICSGSCAGANCGCHAGCGSRKFGCTHFRYGQCNNQIECIGPIVCRVVTCEAPWSIDPTCGRTVRIDEATRNHNAPCLQDPVPELDGDFTKLTVTRDGVRVVGYVLDTSVGRVEIVANNQLLTTVHTTARPPAGQQDRQGARWFDARVHPPVGSVSLCARIASDDRLIACERVQVPGSVPIGRVDVANGGPESIVVSGWAFDPDVDKAVELHVYVDGAFAEKVSAGLSRPDVRGVYPQAPPDSGFRVKVPATRGSHTVWVYAIGQGNRTANQIIANTTVAVPGGPSFGVIDFAEVGAQGLVASGWVIDPDTRDPVEVHAYLDGAFAGKAIADRPRTDVARVHAGYGPAHGYRITLPIEDIASSHELCLYAIDKGGDGNTRFACADIEPPPGLPFGVVERFDAHAEGVRVSGWVVDPDLGTASTTVVVTIDGRETARGPADEIRDDVARVHGAGRRHGFVLVAPASPGRREVCVEAIDNTGVVRTVGCRSVTVG